MKKTYIVPTVELIDVQTEALLLTISNTESVGGLGVSDDDTEEAWSKTHVFEVDVWGLDEEGYE